jgi:hypothetical protein
MKTCLLAVFFAAGFAPAQTSGRFVQAELLTGIKTKTAAVGDAVKARVASSANLPNGTMLPRNTEIFGQVRAVDANSVAISFDRIDLDGKPVPLHLSIRAAMAPDTGQNTPAQAGSVIGLRGVTLEVDDGPQHASKFRAEGKNLQLKPGLQLMLGVVP